MFQKFYPSEDIRSTYDIDFERYYKEGYRGVIFDVDNTLVPHNAPADERAKKLFKRLDAMGMQYCFTSNNKEPRVKSVLRGSWWKILCIQKQINHRSKG